MNASIVPFGIAALFFLVFLVSFLRDRRKLRNGFYLFFVLVFVALGILVVVASLSKTAAALLLFAVLTLIPLSVLALGVFLIGNGVTMLRREGRRPATLLSLLAGIGIVVFIPFHLLVATIGWKPLTVTASVVNDLLAYLSFLFVCFLLYSVIYGRIRTRRGVDFIVVLGAGLLGGTRVPPLLASRLDRGRRVFDAERARGGDPVLITSGGQGPDEQVPESHAMADYLTARNVPRDRLLREDRSRTTWENLTFSEQLMREHKAAHRCVIVTNNFHVLRTALTARKARINGQVVGSPTARYFWPSATIREFVAVVFEHRILNVIVCTVLAASTILQAV